MSKECIGVFCTYHSEKKVLLLYTALLDWFLQPRRYVFTERYIMDF